MITAIKVFKNSLIIERKSVFPKAVKKAFESSLASGVRPNMLTNCLTPTYTGSEPDLYSVNAYHKPAIGR